MCCSRPEPEQGHTKQAPCEWHATTGDHREDASHMLGSILSARSCRLDLVGSILSARVRLAMHTAAASILSDAHRIMGPPVWMSCIGGGPQHSGRRRVTVSQARHGQGTGYMQGTQPRGT